MEKGRLAQLANYTKEKLESGKIKTGSIEEIRFKMNLETIPRRLAVMVTEFLVILFGYKKKYSDSQQSGYYSEEFYKTGNVVLSYILKQRPDLIWPFEDEKILYPENEERVIENARNNIERILRVNSEFINKNQKDLDELIERYEKEEGVTLKEGGKGLVEHGVAPPDLDPEFLKIFKK